MIDRRSCEGAAVCVPITTPISISVEAEGLAKVETFVTVVDPTRAIGISFNRTACAEAKNALTFSDGIMTGYDVTRPSEVASCLSIPLDILSAIISAPVDAITGRTARANAEKALLTAEINLLMERNKLLAQQQAASSME